MNDNTDPNSEDHPLDQPKPNNVVVLGGSTPLNVDPRRVLKGAYDAQMMDVVVLGYDKEGREYFASSMPDGGDVVWLLERMKRRLMDEADALAGEVPPHHGGDSA